MKKIYLLCFCISGLFCIAGCETVAPWERDLLARPEMLLDPNRNAAALKDQVYFSKEASSGGAAAAGAGCGCN